MESLRFVWLFRSVLACLLLVTLVGLPPDAHAELESVGVDRAASATVLIAAVVLVLEDGIPKAGVARVPLGSSVLVSAIGFIVTKSAGSLTAGDCVVFHAGDGHRLRAGDPPPVVLMVGAVPAGSELWRSPPAAGGSRSSGLRSSYCGDEPSAGGAPDAGNTSAPDRVPVARQ